MNSAVVGLMFLLATFSSLAYTALPPIVLTFACPSGSKFNYGMEITEDKNGDGVMDTRSIRDCNGRWTIDCWPVSCNARTIVDEVCPTNYHVFSSAYNTTYSMYLWTITEYVSSTDNTVTGVYARTSPSVETYTPHCTMSILNPTGTHEDDSAPNSASFQLFVNSLANEVSIEFMATVPEAVTVSLMNVAGEVLEIQSIRAVIGRNAVIVPTSMLAHGLYIVRIALGSDIVMKKIYR